MYDVIIIGGSYAGMAAAMPLLRARRKVAIIDAGVRRNRFASHAHGVLALDGKPPGEIAAEAKRQLLAYPTLNWVDDSATGVIKNTSGFEVKTHKRQTLHGARLIVATGVRDQLPEVPGLLERWGQSVFHCPYCHGYELQGGEVGVLATNDMAMHQALMLPDWGPTVLFLNETFVPSDEQLAQLEQRGVRIEPGRVASLSGEDLTVNMDSGVQHQLAGLFVASQISISQPWLDTLGCEMEQSPIGPVLWTDEMKQTSVKHLYACGDNARAAGNVTFAIADGATAGLSAHRSLLFEPLAKA
ncbi:NAD(P)/FAD-dependent oxidoreductase [Gilvimarinus chinensis]|uniref:NAD(P)/FAD-dependent oxidoreductase n=1 Tax=Gilvimarinus chinensis TaxID=396005 RepID=UPI0003663F6C|nr:NAD(P)/FAD-dependent oxidoreductase [Gilvimarinus chinensis]